MKKPQLQVYSQYDIIAIQVYNHIVEVVRYDPLLHQPTNHQFITLAANHKVTTLMFKVKGPYTTKLS